MPCALPIRSEEHTSELQSHDNLVCRLLLEKKKNRIHHTWDGMPATTRQRPPDLSPTSTPRLWSMSRRMQPCCSRLCIFYVFFFFLNNRAPPKFPPFPPPAPFRS